MAAGGARRLSPPWLPTAEECEAATSGARDRGSDGSVPLCERLALGGERRGGGGDGRGEGAGVEHSSERRGVGCSAQVRQGGVVRGVPAEGQCHIGEASRRSRARRFVLQGGHQARPASPLRRLHAADLQEVAGAVALQEQPGARAAAGASAAHALPEGRPLLPGSARDPQLPRGPHHGLLQKAPVRRPRADEQRALRGHHCVHRRQPTELVEAVRCQAHVMGRGDACLCFSLTLDDGREGMAARPHCQGLPRCRHAHGRRNGGCRGRRPAHAYDPHCQRHSRLRLSRGRA
mmetsp:Transcript_12276/g.49266  ORF Transcript_12276/g.49266 Transcript_12276/m.49266 type:complete len:291 (+) Transcript_12276:207-1079(+)